jgi:hypothetical protein
MPFQFSSFSIGILLGLLIMLVLVWIAYNSRIFVFTYCPTSTPTCSASDYFNDPGEALAHGANIDDILFLNDKNILLYKRVPNTTTCTPGPNQIVPVPHPEFCSFSGSGLSGITGTRVSIHDLNTYNINVPGRKSTVLSRENCVPDTGQFVTSGIPLIQWSTAPLLVL